jgi:hypothetical protein
MKVLLDTPAMLWWWGGDHRLTKAAQTVIADQANEIFVSAASILEIATNIESASYRRQDDCCRASKDMCNGSVSSNSRSHSRMRNWRVVWKANIAIHSTVC